MKLAHDIKPVSYLKASTAQLLKQVNDTGRPVVITQHGQASAVVMDVATFESLRDAALMLRLLSEAEHDLAAGRTATNEEVFAPARKKLAASRK